MHLYAVPYYALLSAVLHLSFECEITPINNKIPTQGKSRLVWGTFALFMMCSGIIRLFPFAFSRQ